MLDVLLIVAVVLLVFGSKKLRTLGSDLGSAVKGVRKSFAAGASGKHSERVESSLPDAEFPETAAAKRRDGDGA